jgi:hypothetical protein
MELLSWRVSLASVPAGVETSLCPRVLATPTELTVLRILPPDTSVCDCSLGKALDLAPLVTIRYERTAEVAVKGPLPVPI